MNKGLNEGLWAGEEGSVQERRLDIQTNGKIVEDHELKGGKERKLKI